MVAVAPRGDAAELGRFRRLVSATIVATFVLILIGGIVRVSDSGLGCGAAGSGTHGWPLCEGGLLPAASAESVIEFSHRIAAGFVAVLIALCAWRALRGLRSHRALVRGSLAAGVLVLVQAGLGGLTVERGLEEELVAAHLGLAMLLLGLLVVMRRGAEPSGEAPHPERSAGLRTLSWLTALLVLATIVAGGYVAGTEGEGTAAEPRSGAHYACGQTFPGCLGEFMPFGTSRLTDIHLTHRLFMYLASAAVLAMAAVALRRRTPSRAFLLAVALLAGQIALGVLNVVIGEKHAGLIVGHLMLGTLLWSTVVYAAATLTAVARPVASRIEHPEVAEAATA